MNKKRGFYFGIDALLGAIVIIVLIIAIPKFYTQKTSTDNIQFVAEDLKNILANTKVRDSNNQYIRELITNKTINNTDYTIIEQVAEFWALGFTTESKNIINELTKNLVPAQYGYGVYIITSNPFIPSLVLLERNITSKNITQLVGSRQLVSGFQDGTTIYGKTSRAFLTGINELATSSYIYYGGYIGDGNISSYLKLPKIKNVTQVYIELNQGNNFTLFVNGNASGYYANKSGYLNASTYYVDSIHFKNFKKDGNPNNITIIFNKSTSNYIGGGYIRVKYVTDEVTTGFNSDYRREYLPGVEGLINEYSGISVPGNLSNISIYLHFNAPNYTLFLNIGNTTLWENTTQGETINVITNSTIGGLINFKTLDVKTTPLRLGTKNLTFGTGGVDVVLITDLSGSMTWRLDTNGVNGVVRNCNDPNISNSDTRRISLAKCNDKDFVDIILNESLGGNPNNRISLVVFNYNASGFSGGVNLDTLSTVLSNNATYLKNIIDTYPDSPSGGTCSCCAENKAYNILNFPSSRKKFVIFMTDGIPSEICRAVPDSGSYSCSSGSEFKEFPHPGAKGNFKKLVYANSTFGFAVGTGGIIYKFNGSDWTNFVSSIPNSAYLEGIDMFYLAGSPRSYGFVTGYNGAGTIYSWNGADWVINYSNFSAGTIYSVDLFNEGLGLAVGIGGRIYKLCGPSGSWVTQDSPVYGSGAFLKDVKFVSNTLAFAIGAVPKPGGGCIVTDESGNCIQYAPGGSKAVIIKGTLIGCTWTWTNVTDPDIGILDYLNGLDFSSINFGYAGGNRALFYNGTNWTLNGSSSFIENINLYLSSGITYGFAIGSNSVTNPTSPNDRLSLTNDPLEPWKITYLNNGEADDLDIRGASNDIEFLNQDLAYAVGDRETILKWNRFDTPTFSVIRHYYQSDYYDIDFYNKTLGFIVGTYGRIVRWNGTAFYDDNSPTRNHLRDVKIFDRNLAFAVGDLGMVLRWNGNTWTQYSSPTTNNLTAIDSWNYTCTVSGSPTNCYIATIVGKSGTLLNYSSSLQSGVWTVISSPTTNDLNGIKYYNDTFAFAVGNSGKIIVNRGYKTTGSNILSENNWFNDAQGSSVTTNNLNDVIFYNEFVSQNQKIAYAVGNFGTLLKWTDTGGGGSWVSDISGTTKDLWALDMDNKTFTALGVAIPSLPNDVFDVRIKGVSGPSELSWSTQSADTFGDNKYCDLGIKFLNTTEAYAVGQYQVICKWTRGSAPQATCQGTDVYRANAGCTCTGADCYATNCGCPKSNAYYSSCRLNTDLNVTVHSIGYIDPSACPLGNQSLTEIAQCGKGNYYSSINASELKKIYEDLAKSLLNFSYEAQYLNITGGIGEKAYLYYDSYIEFNYNPIQQPSSIIPVTLETNVFGNNISSGVFNIAANETVIEAKVTSYSEDKWTEKVYLNNNLTYNLSQYGSLYTILGDPYTIQLPLQYIMNFSNNLVNVSIGAGGFNFGGSPSNRIIYTLGLNLFVNYGGVYATAFGCTWIVEYQDGAQSIITIPSSYAGPNVCTYTPTTFSDKSVALNGATNDAMANAVYNLFYQLDFDKDGRLNVKFNQNQLNLEFISVPGIPFLLGPHLVEIRVWQ